MNTITYPLKHHQYWRIENWLIKEHVYSNKFCIIFSTCPISLVIDNLRISPCSYNYTLHLESTTTKTNWTMVYMYDNMFTWLIMDMTAHARFLYLVYSQRESEISHKPSFKMNENWRWWLFIENGMFDYVVRKLIYGVNLFNIYQKRFQHSKHQSFMIYLHFSWCCSVSDLVYLIIPYMVINPFLPYFFKITACPNQEKSPHAMVTWSPSVVTHDNTII